MLGQMINAASTISMGHQHDDGILERVAQPHAGN